MAEKMISFVIPTYNSEATISKCVESVLRQKVKKEVLVIDDGSTDGTEKVLKKFSGKILYVKQQNRGPASARNLGLSRSKGAFVAFVDSDVNLPGGWAEKALEALENKSAAAAGGPGIGAEDKAISKSLNAFLYGKGSDKEYFVDSLATMDVLYRRSVLKGMRFDESFTSSSGEDPDLNFRLVAKGYRLLFSPSLWVYHHHPMTISGIMKKWFNYGKHYPLLYSKHKELKSKGYYGRVLFFPVLLSLLALSLFNVYMLVPAGLQILMLYVIYMKMGLGIPGRPNLLLFSAIHTLKQMSQMFGMLLGIRKLL